MNDRAVRRHPSARRRSVVRSRARTPGGNPRRRLVALLVVLLLVCAGTVVRLASLQAVDRERYVAFGESQRVRSVTLPADRGSVFDRNGHDLALSITERTVWADPRMVTDPAATAAALAPVLQGADPDDPQLGVEALEARLEHRGAFVYLARKVPRAVAEAVEELELDGVFFLDEPRRFTPAGDLGHSVLGTVGVDNEGLSGLELQFEEVLAGSPGELILERDPDGRTIPAGEYELRPAERGDDLVLTLDRSLQYEAERVLGAGVDATGADGGMAVITRPATGEVLALANMVAGPGGEPARPSGNNMALTTVFEPGSVNKVITVASALEQGVVTPASVLHVPDHLQVADHRFTDHDEHATAAWTPGDILTTSSNVGTIMLARDLGAATLDDYLRRFGFGRRTSLDVPYESAGLMLPPDRWSGTSIGTIPIGQGISVTAMQMLTAFNVIANDGEYVAPRLVRATIGADGRQRRPAPSERHRVVSEETAATLRAMLAEVVHAGTGAEAAIDGYTVAGKTGTARKPQSTGGYTDAAGRYHYMATFAGFVPAEDPQLSMIVVLDEPTSSIFGGDVAAPVFAELARYALRHLRVPPPVVAGQPADPAATPLPEAAGANDVPGGTTLGPAGPAAG